MRNSKLCGLVPLLLFASAIGLAGPAVAQETESDRLRDALRGAIARTRQLEDQLTLVQAKQVEADKDRKRLNELVKLARDQTKAAEKAQVDAVNEYNKRLEEMNAVVDKWKAAYEEAATVAGEKDAERAKFEGESKAFKASAKACAARNIKLVGVGNDLLQRLYGLQLGDVIVAHEPLVGFKRVEIQNLLRDYQDKILEQRASQ